MNLFPRNVHSLERYARMGLGLFLVSLVFWGPQTAWGLVGIVPIITGGIGSCPLYTVFGWSTCKKS